MEGQWGSAAAASAGGSAAGNGNGNEATYVTVSSAHGVDSRGGSDGRSGTSSSSFAAESAGYDEGVHSFRQSHEHGPSFLGSGILFF